MYSESNPNSLLIYDDKPEAENFVPISGAFRTNFIVLSS